MYFHILMSVGQKMKKDAAERCWMDVIHRFDLASIFYWQLFYVRKHGRDLGKYFGIFLQSFLYAILEVWWERFPHWSHSATQLQLIYWIWPTILEQQLAWIVKFRWALLYWDLLRDAILSPSWKILKWSKVGTDASAEKSLLLNNQPGIQLRITFVS